MAKEAGADSVKFQLIYPEGLYLPRLYTNGSYQENDVFQKRLKMMLTDDEYRELAYYTRSKSLGFSTSVFDKRGVDLLHELDVPYIKIASCDLNNSHLLRYAAETGRKLVISTGMATLSEIDRAVDDVTLTGNTDIVLLHCVSVYPAPTEIMNVGFIQTVKTAFGLPVGFSDHTENSVAVALAVALGIDWVEKHYTFDRKAEGFDHAYAMEPEMFTAYIQDIRAAEKAISNNRLKIGDAEANTKLRARRALYAARDMQVGEKLTEADVLIVRPEGPLNPNDLHLILGRVLQCPIHQYEALRLEQFMG
jgi:sialic acid synthase SpsE